MGDDGWWYAIYLWAMIRVHIHAADIKMQLLVRHKHIAYRYFLRMRISANFPSLTHPWSDSASTRDPNHSGTRQNLTPPAQPTTKTNRKFLSQPRTVHKSQHLEAECDQFNRKRDSPAKYGKLYSTKKTQKSCWESSGACDPKSEAYEPLNGEDGWLNPALPIG